MRRTLLSLALTLAVATPALAQDAPRAWIVESDAHAQRILAMQARFSPEFASSVGLPGHDGLAIDLGPGIEARQRAAGLEVLAQLQAELAAATDANVRQDLAIMVDAVQRDLDGSALGQRTFLAWTDAPQLVFGGLSELLQAQNPADKQRAAIERLRRYVGLHAGSESVFAQARARFEEDARTPGQLGPVRAEVEQALANAPTYAAGLREEFAARGLADAEGVAEALDALEAQSADFVAWARGTVLPLAREDARLPDEVYAFGLRQYGIDIDPRDLARRAMFEYVEIRHQMEAIARRLAEERSYRSSDYREVLRELKRDRLAADAVVPHYRDTVMPALERMIEEQRVVGLPTRPVIMRLASAAESAAQPAPHMDPPPFIGNTGEQGQFVLTMGNPDASGDSDGYDDFTHAAAAWTLSAHEARPGHELQFATMVEQGVSLARSLYAFNSVNVEGWALYAEAEMVPYEPLDGQLVALQFRLLRAARAFLDPQLNLGLTTREEARRILEDEVVLSPAMARQELDRYQFRAPGQAGSYFYGYTRILELRAETELALGERFDRKAFNDFLLAQGLLPPDLMAQAVREVFIPAQRAR